MREVSSKARAEMLISQLTLGEKLCLDAMLSSLEQKRLPYPSTVFQTRLRELREAAGYKTQQAFADAFGVAQSTIGNWKSDKKVCYSEIIKRPQWERRGHYRKEQIDDGGAE